MPRTTQLRRYAFAVAALALSACRDVIPAPPIASDEDVHRFVRTFALWSPTDTACTALAPYFSFESRGFAAYTRKFGVGQRELCRAVRRSPDRYTRLAAMLPALDSATGDVQRIVENLRRMVPAGRAPDVYFVVGNGISGGTTIGGGRPIILVGMELSRSVADLPWVIAHEFVHTQQHYPRWGSLTGGPMFLRGTLLRQSIMEGSADFVAELATGRPVRNAYAEANEAELWTEFDRDRHSRDYRKWLYNGRDTLARGDRPPDLGYWIGYRITKTYYERASNKSDAIRQILTISDFDRFLAESGYHGGTAAVRGALE